jgi:hypothetical protein
MSIRIKPSHKRFLHKELGVPEGKKIPASKIAKAEKCHLRPSANRLHSPRPAKGGTTRETTRAKLAAGSDHKALC